LRLAVTAWNAASSGIASLGPGVALGLGAGALAAAVVIARLVPSRARLAAIAGLAVLGPAVASPGVVRTAGLLLTPPGTVSVVAGFIWVTYRDNGRRLLPLFAPFAAEAVLWLAWRERTTWPADFRRFVPVVLPLGLLFAGALASRIAAFGAWARRGAWLAVAGLAAASLWQAWPILRVAPMRGVHAQVEEIANRIPTPAIVISDRSGPSHLSLALQTTFGRDGLQVTERIPGGAFQAFAGRALAAGRRVFVALTGYQGDLPRNLRRSDLEGMRVALSSVVPLTYTALESSSVVFPRRLLAVATEVDLYEITGAGTGPAPALPFTADLGERDFAFVLRGFHAGESMPSARARWTTGEAQIALPRLAVAGPTATLVARLAAYRPPGITPPTVRVEIDGAEIGTIARPGPGFAEYRLPLDSAAVSRLRAGESTLAIIADTFVPKAAGLGDDTRVLGVAVDWIRVE
jgi:hypothetical protein